MSIHSGPRGLSRRVLLASSDGAVHGRIAAALSPAGLEIVLAQDAEEALALFARQSFTVLIVDRTLGNGDGLTLVQQVRALAIESVYAIMLTADASSVQIQRGYCAGVDQHMPRTLAGTAILDRVQAAFKAIALRRANRASTTGHEVTTVDLASGAHTARHLVGRLSAEIALARQARRPLHILIMRVSGGQGGNAEDQLAHLIGAVQTAVRPRADWMACLHSLGHDHRVAIVMPDADEVRADAVEQHVRNAVALAYSGAQAAPQLSFGHVTFHAVSDTEVPTALELLAQAEPQRRNDRTGAGAAAALTA